MVSESCICDLSYSRSWFPILCWHFRLQILVYNQKRKWLSLKSSANIDSTVLTNTHTSCTYGINCKLLRRFVLKLWESQTCGWKLPTRPAGCRQYPISLLAENIFCINLLFSAEGQKTWKVSLQVSLMFCFFLPIDSKPNTCFKRIQNHERSQN